MNEISTKKPDDAGNTLFRQAEERAGQGSGKKFPVRSRGRPKSDDAEMRRRERRRSMFGAKLRRMREAKGLTLAKAANEAGISSPRKLSQYETTCYPPGWVIRAIAPVYGVDERKLADLVLKYSDPEMHKAIHSDGRKDAKNDA
jgi:DNA-binding XRE family transcriptional regulator